MENKDILRWVVLIGGIPIWWPYLRTLWKDFNTALSEDGGLFGSAPRGRELDRVREQKSREFDPLVSEPWARAGDRRAPRTSGSPRAAQAGTPQDKKSAFRSSKAQDAQRPGGFRK